MVADLIDENSAARIGVPHAGERAQLGRRSGALDSDCHHARKGVQGVMPPFLQFHALAAMRGDGLRPELRILFERLAEVPEAASSVAVCDCHLADLIEYSSLTMSVRDPAGQCGPKRGLRPQRAESDGKESE